MATPHIESEKSDIAKIVIMPGDPKRVEYIAKNYLSSAKLINEVRGELGFTGYYKNVKVTVFSSGMGIPSMGIYSHELFSEYDVDTIIRIGSAGSYSEDLNVNDLYLVESSYSENNYAFECDGNIVNLVESNEEVNDVIEKTSKELGINLKKGVVHSTGAFYTKNFDMEKIKKEHDCKCVEMETFSLFYNAKRLGKKASCILTISDSFITGDKLSSEEREKNFNDMIKLSLESVVNLEHQE